MCIDSQSRALLERFSCGAGQLLGDGAASIDDAGAFGAQPYLHDLFPPLSEDVIDRLELELGHALPDSFRRLLLEYNGMYLFQGTLALYGSRGKESTEPSMRQPLPLEARNVYLRPVGAHPDDFFIGHYYWDGSLLFMRGGDEVCFRKLGSAEVLLTWPSLECFLKDEIERLSQYFDHCGNEVEPTRSTLPLS